MRYNTIVELLITGLSYKIKSSGIDEEGKNYRILIRTDDTEALVNESYELTKFDKRLIRMKKFLDKNITPELLRRTIKNQK